MKTNRLFAIDVDAVLRDNLGTMLELYNKEFNDTMKLDDIVEYKTDIMFPRIPAETGTTAQQWFFQDHSKELFLDAKPFPHVAEDIERLRTLGNVAIVTHQKSYQNKYQTLEWLEKNNIKYDSLVFTKDKSIIDCFVMVDDNDWNFIGCKAQIGCLIDAPYNRATDFGHLMTTNSCKTMYRKASFHDFVEDFMFLNDELPKTFVDNV